MFSTNVEFPKANPHDSHYFGSGKQTYKFMNYKLR